MDFGLLLIQSDGMCLLVDNKKLEVRDSENAKRIDGQLSLKKELLCTFFSLDLGCW